MLLEPPERVVFGPNPVEGLRISDENGRMRLKVSVTGPVVEDIMVFGAAPCSAGRKKWRHGAYLGLLPAPVGGESDITEIYVERYGEPEAGKRVFIRTRQQRNGWEGHNKDSSEVVPAEVVVAARPRECRGMLVEFNELHGLQKDAVTWGRSEERIPRTFDALCAPEPRGKGGLLTPALSPSEVPTGRDFSPRGNRRQLSGEPRFRGRDQACTREQCRGIAGVARGQCRRGQGCPGRVWKAGRLGGGCARWRKPAGAVIGVNCGTAVNGRQYHHRRQRPDRSVFVS
jgi:hypothetical protein